MKIDNGSRLVGHKIVIVRRLQGQEMVGLGWHAGMGDTPTVLQLDNNDLVIVQADAEGNGPGCLVVNAKKRDYLIVPK